MMNDEREPSPETAEDERAERERVLRDHIQSVRLGHGANCSSIGSVVDTLFASAVVTGAIFAAVCAALAREKITVVGSTAKPAEPAETSGTAKSEEREPPGV